MVLVAGQRAGGQRARESRGAGELTLQHPRSHACALRAKVLLLPVSACATLPAMVDPPLGATGPEDGTAVFDRLAQREFVIVSGKGGVGRTTMAAVIGLRLAARGRRVLVATMGHDDRLAWMLGESTLSDTPTQVGEGLSIQRLIPQTCLREYGTLVIGSARVASVVFDNKVVRSLLHAMPGLDDFAVVGKAWHEAARGDDYDVVIFDGPATGHILYTLGLPNTLLQALPPGPLTKEARLMQNTLADSARTEAVLVGLPERWPLTELAELGSAMRERIGVARQTVIVNGLWPSAGPSLGEAVAAAAPQSALHYLAELDAVGQGQRHEIASWLAGGPAQGLGVDGVLAVPWVWDGPCDRAALERLGELIDRDTPSVEVG